MVFDVAQKAQPDVVRVDTSVNNVLLNINNIYS